MSAAETSQIPSHLPVSHIRTLPLETRISHLPEFLQSLLSSARQSCDVEKIILFGSRARGDETPLSDWDLCFVVAPQSELAWIQFADSAPEKARTLLKIDFVNWNVATAALRANILSDGIVLFEKLQGSI